MDAVFHMSIAAAIKKFKLSPRESDVARLLARGMDRKQIANELTITVRTVDKTLANIRRKSSAPSTYRLVSMFAA